MDRFLFNEKFVELQINFGRRSNEQLAQFYYKELCFMTNDDWTTVCKEILDNDEKWPVVARFKKSKTFLKSLPRVPSGCGKHGCTDGIVTLIDTVTLYKWAVICPNPDCPGAYFQSHIKKDPLQEATVYSRRKNTDFYTDYLSKEYDALPPLKKAKYDRFLKAMLEKYKKLTSGSSIKLNETNAVRV